MKIVKYSKYFKDFVQYLVIDDNNIIVAVLHYDTITKQVFKIRFIDDAPATIKKVLEASKHVDI